MLSSEQTRLKAEMRRLRTQSMKKSSESTKLGSAAEKSDRPAERAKAVQGAKHILKAPFTVVCSAYSQSTTRSRIDEKG